MSASFSSFRTPGFPHSKYLQHSDHDWKYNNSFQYNLADGDCSRSEAVVVESERLCQQTQHQTEQHKTQVERRFDQRIADVDHWRKEGDQCIAKLQEAVDRLAHMKLRCRQAAESCRPPLLACRKAMLERDKRLGVDMVQDRPQLEIQKYQLHLEEVAEVLEKTIQQIEDQQIASRAAKQKLLRDVTDKQATLEIDTHAASCRPENAASKGFKFDPQLLSADRSACSTAEWERITRHNIESAEQEMKTSRNFLPKVEELLDRTYVELTKQRLRVIESLNDRIREMTSAEKNLEERLSRLQKQVLDVEDTLFKLDQSMERKLPSMELASNRMEGRRRRPRHELCHDEVDAELEEEVRSLSLSMHRLRGQSGQAKEMLRKLEQTRLSLQKEAEVKKNSLYIDQEHCLNTFANVNHVRH